MVKVTQIWNEILIGIGMYNVHIYFNLMKKI